MTLSSSQTSASYSGLSFLICGLGIIEHSQDLGVSNKVAIHPLLTYSLFTALLIYVQQPTLIQEI